MNDLPEPPDSYKARVIKEESAKRFIAGNLQMVAFKMIAKNRVRWPGGAYNPKPLVLQNREDGVMLALAKANEISAASQVEALLSYHPGFE